MQIVADLGSNPKNDPKYDMITFAKIILITANLKPSKILNPNLH